MRPRADPVGPGQESVWDYPRPPIVEASAAHVVIQHAGVVIAETRNARRTLETSHPPSFYVPRADIRPEVLRRAAGGSFCEWKGEAIYWDVVLPGEILPAAAWSYPTPSPAFAALKDHLAFYATPFDLCSVDGARIRPQPGGFYGGWITPWVAGPFKGGPGSRDW